MQYTTDRETQQRVEIALRQRLERQRRHVSFMRALFKCKFVNIDEVLNAHQATFNTRMAIVLNK